MDLVLSRKGNATFLDWGMGPRRCAVGRGGIADKSAEGDGVTPRGRWEIRGVLYRPDRVKPPATFIEAKPIARDDGWCDAPPDKNYNRPVKLPYAASAEMMWRDDALYDVVVVLGFNDTPVVPGKGSAIFLHVAKPDFSPTEGCIALSREDLLDAVTNLAPGDSVHIP